MFIVHAEPELYFSTVLLVLYQVFNGARGYMQRIKKCQLKSDRFNYKRDSVGIISVTHVSRLRKTRFTKIL